MRYAFPPARQLSKTKIALQFFFAEIGADHNHANVLIQSEPVLLVKCIVQAVKSIAAKKFFRLHPEVKQQFRGGNF
ncbi:transposase [Sphingobacterium spiritivorum]|uniref:transposase n=1 Tax=Sphingobacterium spiritivorum TaxID=258 RepID=UPI0012F86953|nr:transposase [Sphingobacterium spiritivorum]